MSVNNRIFYLTMLKSRIRRELNRSSRSSYNIVRTLRLVRLNERLRARLSVLLRQRLNMA